MAGSVNPVALNCLSYYSFLRGASSPAELIEQAAELGYQALAITDECSLAGVVRAYVANQQLPSPLQLLIGSSFDLAEQGRWVVLVRDHQGYTQLCELITKARSRCSKGAYQLGLDDLAELDPSHVILLWRPELTGAMATVTQHLLPRFEGALYLAFSRHYHSDDAARYRAYQHYHQVTGLPIVAACEVLYHQRQQQPLFDVMQAIRERQAVTQIVEHLPANHEYCLRSVAELQQCYPHAWLEQAGFIAQKCHFCLSELRYQYPSELVPEGQTATAYLRELTYAGAKRRFPDGLSADVQAKLEKELGLIEQLEYEYFFLTIYDIVQFAQQRGILYQGRGSAANSVVCYCLEITAVNPAQIDVLFERFISAERDEPPDIDVDFEHQRREEVIQYIYQKYGRKRAALAATVVRYRLKSAFRDVGKALGFREQALRHYLQRIDRRDREYHWREQLLEQVPELAQTQRGRWLLDLTQALIGTPRHLSQHVGGFVIASRSLAELVPVENASMPERTVIQWDKDDIEALRLIKVDILALGMLSALQKMLTYVRGYGQTAAEQQLSLATIPSEDAKVYQMLQQADSIGIFQIESRAQMNMLPRLKPATFYDLVVQIAIVRPGPIQGDMVHPYLRRRAGLEPIEYPSAAVKQVLERTLGVPIFQEQVIKLAMVAAGFSGGEADQLRRAMANWQRSGKLKKFERKLIEGMRARGYSDDFAKRIYQQILGFGEYGFPESHSASFANLAYASAWMKYHHPAAFYCALLNSLPMGFYSADQLLQDAKRHHVPLLPVDIQFSQWDHQLVELTERRSLRLGLRLIKGLSRHRIEALIAQRPAQGFQSLQQLQHCGARRHELQALAAADALAGVSGHRYQSQWQSLAVQEQPPLFAELLDDLNDEQVAAPTEIEEIRADYQHLGLSLRRHPLAILREQGKLRGYKTAAELSTCRSGQFVQISGLVTCRQRPGTSSGVTFITLEDETGQANIVIWLATARQFRQAYLRARLLKVKGVVEIHAGVVHVIAGQLFDESEHLRPFQLDRKRSRDFH